jgi:hypothetical protein
MAQYVRAITAFAAARAAVASAYETPKLRQRRLREARRLSRHLERGGVPWMSALASLAAAAVANAEGDLPAARSHLQAAAAHADTADMSLHACAARHRLGTLLREHEGRTLVEQAEDAMRAKAIQAPARYVGMLVPGRWS